MLNNIDKIGNEWLAVPLIIDFRNLRYNVTTFELCKGMGYDLHPPPVIYYKFLIN